MDDEPPTGALSSAVEEHWTVSNFILNCYRSRICHHLNNFRLVSNTSFVFSHDREMTRMTEKAVLQRQRNEKWLLSRMILEERNITQRK